MTTQRRTRISDIAKRLGVSNATVSRALSGDGYVKQDLADAIRAAALDMNYPLPSRAGGTQVIVAASYDAMVDLGRSQFTMHVLDGLRARADALGLTLDVQAFQDFAAVTELTQSADVLGLLLLTIDDATLTQAHDLTCPVVLVNGDDPAMRFSSVTPCNRSAAALATRHLIDRGHDRIVFLTRPGRRTIQRRREGWQDAMAGRFDPALVIEVPDWTAEAGQTAIRQSLARGERFSGIVAAGDILAMGAIAALNEAGLSVPKDVSVIGIDGLPQGRYVTPPLSSVEIPMPQVGAMALDLLCEDARNRDISVHYPVRRIELACKLVNRGSVAPAL